MDVIKKEDEDESGSRDESRYRCSSHFSFSIIVI